jgi:L-rhamnose mutarotase
MKTMAKIGFRLKVREGKQQEYIDSHAKVWPELLQEIKDAGIRNYSIFLDGRDLFLYCEIDGDINDFVSAWKRIQATEISQKWSQAMSSLLEPAQGIGEEQAPPMMRQVFYLE